MKSNNKSKYSKAIVTFFDILGFCSMVRASEVESYLVEKIVRSLHILSTEGHTSRPFFVSYSEHESTKPPQAVKPIFMCFSDSIARVVPVRDLFETGFAVIREVETLASVQRKLLQEGLLIRGSITFGDIYIDEKSDILFGPAFLRAQDLERKVQYPRIMLDPDLLAQFETSSSIMFLYRDSKVLCKEENDYYVDYLGVRLPDAISEAMKNHRNVDACQKAIEKSIVQHSELQVTLAHLIADAKDDPAFKKVQWVIEQYNAAYKALVTTAIENELSIDVLL